MATQTDDGSGVQGGAALPVYLKNLAALAAAIADAGGAITIANGADVAQGSTTDPAIVADQDGTAIGFLRGLVVLDDEILQLLTARTPATLGAKTRANSLAVTLPTDATAMNAQEAKLNINGTVVTAAADGATLTTRVPMLQQLYNGATADLGRATTGMKTAQSTATATGSDLTVWTPAVGKKFRLRSLHARASNAGRYEVRDGTGTVIGYTYLAANIWTEIIDMDANGHLSAAANNVLLLRNQSGGNSDMDAIASGNEE